MTSARVVQGLMNNTVKHEKEPNTSKRRQTEVEKKKFEVRRVHERYNCTFAFHPHVTFVLQ